MYEEERQGAADHQQNACCEYDNVRHATQIIKLTEGDLRLKKREKYPEGEEGRNDRHHLSMTQAEVQCVNLHGTDSQGKNGQCIKLQIKPPPGAVAHDFCTGLEESHAITPTGSTCEAQKEGL
mmetsp:Transcript_61627/g.144493  ORF Transcript_61627/g.144493 Transcript_61627/m.144493 type:complete len:123 (+) Transcript_61627:273-641(+)